MFYSLESTKRPAHHVCERNHPRPVERHQLIPSPASVKPRDSKDNHRPVLSIWYAERVLSGSLDSIIIQVLHIVCIITRRSVFKNSPRCLLSLSVKCMISVTRTLEIRMWWRNFIPGGRFTKLIYFVCFLLQCNMYVELNSSRTFSREIDGPIAKQYAIGLKTSPDANHNGLPRNNFRDSPCFVKLPAIEWSL